MRYFFLTLFILLGSPVLSAQETTTTQSSPATPNAQAAPKTEDSPEERAYKAQLIQLSQQITAKITEIQNKQKEIDGEIYPAYVPPLQGDKQALMIQLQNLEMQRDQLETQKKAKDLQKQLNAPIQQNTNQ